MSRTLAGRTETWPMDTAIAANSVVVDSAANVGNVSLPAGAGAVKVKGVTQDGANNSATSPPNYYGAVVLEGVVQCRALTGTAIAAGDPVKTADATGRVTKATIAAAGAGTLTGQVGIAQSAVASGDASDTLVDVLLTPGVAIYV